MTPSLRQPFSLPAGIPLSQALGDDPDARQQINGRMAGRRLAVHYLSAVRELVRQVGVCEVARRSGLHPMTVSRAANEKYGVKLDTFVALALACGFSMTLDHPAPSARKLLERVK